MINDFEKYYSKNIKNIHIEKLRNKRLALKKKYVVLRGELIELLNKFHYEDTEFIVLTDYATIIKKYCSINMDINYSSNAIYCSIRDELIEKININKLKKTLNDVLYSTFTPREYYYLITTEEYSNLINTLKTNDDMTTYVSNPENIQIFKDAMERKVKSDMIVMHVKNDAITRHVKDYSEGSKCKEIIKNYVDNNITLVQAFDQINNLIDMKKREAQVYGWIRKIGYERYYINEGKLGLSSKQTQKQLSKELKCTRDYINCKDVNLIDVREVKRAFRIELASKLMPRIKKIMISIFLKNTEFNKNFEKNISDDSILMKFINDVEYKEYFKESKCIDPTKLYHASDKIKNGVKYYKNGTLPNYIENHLRLIHQRETTK